jgi:hypothetical protein
MSSLGRDRRLPATGNPDWGIWLPARNISDADQVEMISRDIQGTSADLVANRDRVANDRQLAATIMVIGMERGAFTTDQDAPLRIGRARLDFFDVRGANGVVSGFRFTDAPRIVNGINDAEQIGALAQRMRGVMSRYSTEALQFGSRAAAGVHRLAERHRLGNWSQRLRLP